MFNILGSSYQSTTRRDDHGVGELLAAASQRSSCNEHERQELREMARRVRTSQQHQPTTKKVQAQGAQESPSGSTHGSSHGVSRDGSGGGFDSDTIPASKVDLLRGFGPSTSNSESSFHHTSIAHENRNNALLLQDYSPNPEKDVDDNGDDDRSCDSYGY